MQPFDLTSFVLSLLVAGGPAFVISGWIAAHWTHAVDKAMAIQTLIVAVAITFAASVMALIPVPPSDVLTWLRDGLVNGVISMLLYKLGIFNSLLAAIHARTQHQLEA